MSNQNNNNNDNLFTQMFGLESEQPVTEAPTVPLTSAPVTEVPTIPTESTTSAPTTQPVPQPQNELINALNFNNTSSTQVSQPTTEPQNDIMMLAPTTQEELEERTTPETEPEPIIQETRFNPNSLPTTPTDYVPTQFPTYETPDIYEENTTQGKYYFKLILIIVGVFAAIGGWFLFYTNVLKEDNDKEAEQVMQAKQEETVEEQEENEEPEEPLVYPIQFDEEMNFFHSLTTNENELYQTEPYTPEKTTGVIVCTNLQPYSFGSGAIMNEYYLYYEDYKLKKTIHNEISAYSSKEDYATMEQGYAALQQSWADKEGIKVKVNSYPDKLAFHTVAYFNLAYGNYFVTDHDSNIYYRLRYDYNDNIKSTMGTLLGIEAGNLVCSSVITTSDYEENNEI